MDFIPKVDLNFDCCLNFEKHEQFQEIPLEIPLKNILTSMDDLRSTSLKLDQVEGLIKEQENKKFKHSYVPISFSASVLTFIGVMFVCMSCCFCCCKRCKIFTFWCWDMCKPTQCLKETTVKLCVNIFNNSTNTPVHLRSVMYIPNSDDVDEIHISQSSINEVKDEEELYQGPVLDPVRTFDEKC